MGMFNIYGEDRVPLVCNNIHCCLRVINDIARFVLNQIRWYHPTLPFEVLVNNLPDGGRCRGQFHGTTPFFDCSKFDLFHLLPNRMKCDLNQVWQIMYKNLPDCVRHDLGNFQLSKKAMLGVSKGANITGPSRISIEAELKLPQ